MFRRVAISALIIFCFIFSISANVMAGKTPEEMQQYIEDFLKKIKVPPTVQAKPDWRPELTVLTRVNSMPDRQASIAEPVIVWGNTDGLGADTTYEWDFGDGSPVESSAVTDPHYIATSHLYATPGTYTATLRVFDSAVFIDSDSTIIQAIDLTMLPPDEQRIVNVNMTIEDGLRYLYLTQQPGGEWWDAGYTVGPTAEAVLAFENQGYLASDDPNEDIYAEYVQRGLNYLFAHAYIIDIGLQDNGDGTYNDPDTDGDGIGVAFDEWVWNRPMYQSGMAMTAIIGSGIPSAIVSVPGSPVDGWTYLEVIRDAVDFNAWAQEDLNGYWGEGGWRYLPNDGVSYRDADNSNSSWPTLGSVESLLWRAPVVPGGITIPDFVRTQLNLWIDYIQNDATGASGYTSPGDWDNFSKTPGLLIEGALFGDSSSTPRMMAVQHWVDVHWDDGGGYYDNLGNGYGMYNMMKGARLLGITTLPSGRNWYNEYADYLVGAQASDGSWPGWGGWWGTNLETAWSVLILSRGIVSPIGVDLRVINSSAFPRIRLTVFVDSDAGRSGDLSVGNFFVEEDGVSETIVGGSFSFNPSTQEYSFSYDTHNPTADGTLRTVEVIVNDPEGVASDIGTYIAPTAPGIPDISVSPPGFNVTLPAGECEVRELIISNVGGAGTGFTVTDWATIEADPMMKKLFTLSLPPSTFATPPDKDGGIVKSSAVKAPVVASLIDLTGIKISYIKTHKEKDPASYATLIHDLQIRGAEVDFIEGPITPLVLKDEDILWIDEWGTDPWTDEEIESLKHYIKGGGTILIHGDEPGDAARLSEILGIAYTGEHGIPGITGRIHPHPATKDHEIVVDEIKFGNPKNSLRNVEPQPPLHSDSYPIVWYGGGGTSKIDIVFVFDTTGSMWDEIDAMKASATAFAGSVASSGMDARFGLVEYRDNGEILSDGVSTSPSVIVSLTSDVAAFQAGVNGLSANGGGDWEECELEADELSLTMGFRSDAQKIIIKITDAPVHYLGDGSGWSELTIAGVCADLNSAGVDAFVVGPDVSGASALTDNKGNPITKLVLSHPGDPKQLAECTEGLWIDITSGDLSAILERIIVVLTKEAVKGAEYYQYDQDSCKYERGRVAVVSEDIFHDSLIEESDNQLFANLLIQWLASFNLNKRYSLWLAEGQPHTGYLGAGESITIPVTFTTTGTPDDSGLEYHANVQVYSHDPDENIIEVPATLRVIRPTVQIWAEPDEWHVVKSNVRETTLKIDSHANEVTGVELHLSYDSSYIEILDAYPETEPMEAMRIGDFLEGGTVLLNEVNDGRIDVAVIFMGEPSSRSGVGSLGVIKGHILRPPEGDAESVTTTVVFDFIPPDRDTVVSLTSGISVHPSVEDPALRVIIHRGAEICGNVRLQGREDYSATIRFQLLDSSGSVMESWEGATDFFGRFCKDFLPYGVWDLRAKERRYLRSQVSGISLPGMVGDIVFDLRGGDCNDDNVVNIADFSLLAASFGSRAGDPRYDEGADINNDRAVTIKDFGVLASNYGRSGVGGRTSAAPSLDGVNSDALLSISAEGVTSKDGVLYVPYGEVVEVKVEANDVSDLHGYSFILEYDDKSLSLVSTGEEKGFLKANGYSSQTLFISKKVEKGNGLITASSIVGKDTGVSGSGEVASFRFMAIGKTSGVISLKEIQLSDHLGRLNSLQDLLAKVRVVPKRTALAQSYPNPFNPDTWIPYELSSGSDVTIRIYDVTGSLVKRLSLGYKEPGFYIGKSEAAYWDGRNEYGERVSSGVYFYHLVCEELRGTKQTNQQGSQGGFSAMKKMVVVK